MLSDYAYEVKRINTLMSDGRLIVNLNLCIDSRLQLMTGSKLRRLMYNYCIYAYTAYIMYSMHSTRIVTFEGVGQYLGKA